MREMLIVFHDISTQNQLPPNKGVYNIYAPHNHSESDTVEKVISIDAII